jgi:hypothetical protein
MAPIVESFFVLVCVFGSGYLGLALRRHLPQQHLQEESLGMVRLCTGVIATLTALVLGLLIASAKGSYDRVNDGVTSAAADIVLLDRTLAQFGPQAHEARELLRAAVVSSLETVFSSQSHGMTDLDTRQGQARVERLQAELQGLAAENEVQRGLKARALELSNVVAQTRLLTITQAQTPIPPVFLVVLVVWLAIMFAGFGLVTATNRTVIVALFLCALSLAGAVLMIEELSRPLNGLMRVSSAPMRYALEHLGG